MITVILLTIYCILEAAKDKLAHHFTLSIFSKINNEDVREWWDARDSWKKKYARNFKGNFIPAPKEWYYKFFNIKYKEKFPLSATFGVFITDAWHMIKAIQLILIALVIGMFLEGWVYGVSFLMIYRLTFNVFYSRILNK